MRLVVLTNRGSLFGRRLVVELLARGLPVAGVVEIIQPLGYYGRLFRSVARRTSLAQAAFFSLRRLVASPGGGEETPRLSRMGCPVWRTKGTNSPEALAAVKGLRPDLLLLGQAGLVKAEMLGLPRIGTLNAHPGILPEYRGIDVFKWAVLHDRWDKIGVSVHWVDQGVDTGPVLGRVGCSPGAGRTVAQAEADLDRLAVRTLVGEVAVMIDGPVPPGRPQGQGRQYHKMDLRHERIVARKLAGRQDDPARKTGQESA